MAYVLKKQTGFSLLEVIVALFVLGVGLLGLLKMQTDSLASVETAYNKSLATVQAENMLARLNHNETIAARERELNQWNEYNQLRLPDGHGSFQCNGLTHHCLVQITWQQKHRHVLALGSV